MRRLNLVQLTDQEIGAVTQVLRQKGPCRLLVFGLGNDSTFWRRANRGGTTAFLEDDPKWFDLVRRRDPKLDAHLVAYGTRLAQWQVLLDRPDDLALQVPAALDARWDVILIDAPAGFAEDTPGRMQSIYWASQHAPGGDVFVHDCHRSAEAAYCDRYLEPRNLVAEVSDLLRHYHLS